MKIVIEMEKFRNQGPGKISRTRWLVLSIVSLVLAIANAFVLKQLFDRSGEEENQIQKLVGSNDKLREIARQSKTPANIRNSKYQRIPCPGCGMG